VIVCETTGEQNRKLVVRLARGEEVETVVYRGDTVCVSTQVGCAVGCPFCASGSAGFFRNLTVSEIWEQLRLASPDLAFDKITLSGIGEPLHNFAQIETFLLEAHHEGFGVSVTTSGGPLPRLSALLRLPHNGVTISVHAGTEATRKKLVPRGPGLDDLFGLLTAELPTLPRRRRKKTALAYLVIEGENDHDAEVEAFIERASPLGLAVHLYGNNPVPMAPYPRGDRARFESIYAQMRDAGLVVRMSSTARLESVGGCGTLVAGRRISDASTDAAPGSKVPGGAGAEASTQRPRRHLDLFGRSGATGQ
jgi:23S rRNA (adenine2503-C2)-methyltransferase